MPADLPDALCAAVIDQCADVIIFSDRDGIIRLWNRAAERMFGFTAAEALGRLPEAVQAQLRAAVVDDLAHHCCDDSRGGFLVPARTLVASARRPA